MFMKDVFAGGTFVFHMSIKRAFVIRLCFVVMIEAHL